MEDLVRLAAKHLHDPLLPDVADGGLERCIVRLPAQRVLVRVPWHGPADDPAVGRDEVHEIAFAPFAGVVRVETGPLSASHGGRVSCGYDNRP
jgi:hypothetical protein